MEKSRWLSADHDALESVNLFSGIRNNLKSAVLRRLTGTAPVFNPRYVDYPRHHSFEILACNVAAGNEKGRVESGVGYVKKNFSTGPSSLTSRP